MGVGARFIAPGVGQNPHEFLNLHYGTSLVSATSACGRHLNAIVHFDKLNWTPVGADFIAPIADL
jgi:hypothetical protein